MITDQHKDYAMEGSSRPLQARDISAPDNLPIPHSIFKTLDDGIALLDNQGYVLYANPAVQRIFKYHEDLPGTHISQHLHPEAECNSAQVTLPSQPEQWIGLDKTRTIDFTGIIQNHADINQPVQVSITPLNHNSPDKSGWCATIKLQRDKLISRALHLQKMLLAISRINQLISQEKDRNRLLASICISINEALESCQAWIVLTKDGKPLSPIFHTGTSNTVEKMAEQLLNCHLNECGTRALNSPGLHILDSSKPYCSGCPL